MFSWRLVLPGLLVLGSVLTVGSLVMPGQDTLLARFESRNLTFERMEIGDLIVYWHQRMIDGAIVEGDTVIYQIDKNTLDLKKKIEHWRTDLPDHISPTITKTRAESMGRGKILSADLYFISPESTVHHLTPSTTDPCWVVISVEGEKRTTSIIDAMDGRVLGYGIPPPPDKSGGDMMPLPHESIHPTTVLSSPADIHGGNLTATITHPISVSLSMSTIHGENLTAPIIHPTTISSLPAEIQKERPEATQSSGGFGAMGVVAGLLSGFYFTLRQKRR